MTVEQGKPSFEDREIHNQDNCVFFATLEYVRDQFGLELSRIDFERFLRWKISLGTISGVAIPKIPLTIDNILKPHSLAVSKTLFHVGLEQHYRNQLTLKHPIELLEVERFLRDSRVIESEYWDFPFMGLLLADGEVDHIQYIADINNFNIALKKVGGDKGRIPFGIKIGSTR